MCTHTCAREMGQAWGQGLVIEGGLRQPKLGSAKCLDEGDLGFFCFSRYSRERRVALLLGRPFRKGWAGWARAGVPGPYPVPQGPVWQVCALTLRLSPQRGVNTDSGSICREASFEGISK